LAGAEIIERPGNDPVTIAQTITTSAIRISLRFIIPPR
jgi:hypothetical protein